MDMTDIIRIVKAIPKIDTAICHIGTSVINILQGIENGAVKGISDAATDIAPLGILQLHLI
jgi:peroxiredoxin